MASAPWPAERSRRSPSGTGSAMRSRSLGATAEAAAAELSIAGAAALAARAAAVAAQEEIGPTRSRPGAPAASPRGREPPALIAMLRRDLALWQEEHYARTEHAIRAWEEQHARLEHVESFLRQHFRDHFGDTVVALGDIDDATPTARRPSRGASACNSSGASPSVCARSCRDSPEELKAALDLQAQSFCEALQVESAERTLQVEDLHSRLTSAIYSLEERLRTLQDERSTQVEQLKNGDSHIRTLQASFQQQSELIEATLKALEVRCSACTDTAVEVARQAVQEEVSRRLVELSVDLHAELDGKTNVLTARVRDLEARYRAESQAVLFTELSAAVQAVAGGSGSLSAVAARTAVWPMPNSSLSSAATLREQTASRSPSEDRQVALGITPRGLSPREQFDLSKELRQLQREYPPPRTGAYQSFDDADTSLLSSASVPLVDVALPVTAATANGSTSFSSAVVAPPPQACHGSAAIVWDAIAAGRRSSPSISMPGGSGGLQKASTAAKAAATAATRGPAPTTVREGAPEGVASAGGSSSGGLRSTIVRDLAKAGQTTARPIPPRAGTALVPTLAEQSGRLASPLKGQSRWTSPKPASRPGGTGSSPPPQPRQPPVLSAVPPHQGVPAHHQQQMTQQLQSNTRMAWSPVARLQPPLSTSGLSSSASANAIHTGICQRQQTPQPQALFHSFGATATTGSTGPPPGEGFSALASVPRRPSTGGMLPVANALAASAPNRAPALGAPASARESTALPGTALAIAAAIAGQAAALASSPRACVRGR